MNKLIFSLLIYSTLSCSNAGYFMNEKKPHHRKDGFVNPYPTYKEHNFSDFLKWRWNRGSELEKVIDPKNYKFSYVENNAEEIRKNTNKFSVTWIGHATSLIQLDGKNILTDPIWSERCSPLSFVVRSVM